LLVSKKQTEDYNYIYIQMKINVNSIYEKRPIGRTMINNTP